MTSIGDNAFEGCESLASVDILGVENIGDEAFYKCKSLTLAYGAISARNIGKYAFWRCTNLTEIMFANSVRNIGEGAFRDCSCLKTVYIENENVLLDKDGYCPFSFIAEESVLYVYPSYMKEAYEASPYAKVFSQILSYDEMTGIENAGMSSGKPSVKAVYGLDGRNVKQGQRGVNIMRYSDGTVRKVFEK